MNGNRFIDTNVLAYVFDSRSAEKSAVAKRVLREGGFTVSGQVLGELYVTLTRKFADKVPVHVAASAIEDLQVHDVVPITAGLVSAAIETSIQHQLSYWEALIIESAVAAQCGVLLTEDFTDGQTIRGVRIENPFRSLAASPGDTMAGGAQ